MTIYLKTDDCKGISDQYEGLVKNHTELMQVNNSLLKQYTTSINDIITLKNYLKKIDSLSYIEYTNTEKTITYQPDPRLNEMMVVNNDYEDSVVADRTPASVVETPLEEKVEIKKTKVKLPHVLRMYMDSVNKIIKNY